MVFPRLLASVLIFIFVASSKFGKAHEYPHLGAADAVARGYLPEAEVEGEPDQFFPRAGIIGTNAPLIFKKALECLADKHIYHGCDEAHRLSESGELHVPPEYADEYCRGPCLSETHHVLDCIDGILKSFIFYNKASLDDVRDTLESGCGYGPKRGNFNVLEHIQADAAAKSKASNPVIYAIVLMIVGWRVLL